MSFVTTQTGQLTLLKAIINSDVFRLHLFMNNRNPSITDVITNYTELTYLGYAPKLLTPSEWTYQINSLTNNYVASFPVQMFSFNTSVTVFGYYITDSGGTNLLTVERFVNAPAVIQSSGGNINITPTMGVK